LRRISGAIVLCLLLLVPASAQAGDTYNSKPYRQKVTVANMLTHEHALQAIADANHGTRVAGSPGNDQTVDYIASTMNKTGWTVRKQPFEFPFFQELSDPTFQRVSPDPATFVKGTDYQTMDYSGSGDVTGTVQPVDVIVPMDPANPPSTSNSGCEPEDFNGFTPGNIALVQRGTCNFVVKVQNAQDAGAIGVIVFNEGQPGRDDLLAGTLGEPVDVPAVGTTYALGADFANRIKNGQTVTAHIVTNTISETRTTYNVIADSPGGNTDRTVVISAHNDSVPAGPGINDDGSGTAMDLELAKHLGKAGEKPRNHVRFLWVGAEEEGLRGSQFYVDSLTDAQRAQIIAMLDFDMVASPNFARQVYDGDGSTFGPDVSGPNGSGFIESLFDRALDSAKLAHEPIPFDGRSDYVAFTNAGIPAGGLFTGAESEKTPEQAALYGGTAGVALDPCYHQACDTFANLNTQVFGEMKDAAADVVYQLALTKNAIVDGSSIKPGSGNKSKSKAAAARTARKRSKIGHGIYRGETARR
jgi:Zn-dependent M28 family amino/carboxypeptidase